eukprot:gene9335-biopygen8892
MGNVSKEEQWGFIKNVDIRPEVGRELWSVLWLEEEAEEEGVLKYSTIGSPRKAGREDPGREETEAPGREDPGRGTTARINIGRHSPALGSVRSACPRAGPAAVWDGSRLLATLSGARHPDLPPGRLQPGRAGEAGRSRRGLSLMCDAVQEAPRGNEHDTQVGSDGAG